MVANNTKQQITVRRFMNAPPQYWSLVDVGRLPYQDLEPQESAGAAPRLAGIRPAVKSGADPRHLPHGWNQAI
jgi:hypothetical protein